MVEQGVSGRTSEVLRVGRLTSEVLQLLAKRVKIYELMA